MHVYQVFLYFIQSGASPLMIGSQCGMLEVVRTLLRFHARVDVFDEVNVSLFATNHIVVLSLFSIQESY